MPEPCLSRPWNRETTRKRFILEAGDAYAMGRGDAAFTDQRAKEYPALKGESITLAPRAWRRRFARVRRA